MNKLKVWWSTFFLKSMNIFFVRCCCSFRSTQKFRSYTCWLYTHRHYINNLLLHNLALLVKLLFSLEFCVNVVQYVSICRHMWRFDVSVVVLQLIALVFFMSVYLFLFILYISLIAVHLLIDICEVLFSLLFVHLILQIILGLQSLNKYLRSLHKRL